MLEGLTIIWAAEQADKTTARAVLQWHIQCGDVVFPKSATPSRMRENFEFGPEAIDASTPRSIGARKGALAPSGQV